MRAKLLQLLLAIRASYWFIPSVMALLSIVAAVVAIWFDQFYEVGYHEAWLGTGPNTPEAARVLLSTVAGSLITVAGVCFAITISAVVHATTQFGPRLLSMFLRNRGNQVTLGIFVANFLYCLVVLRSIRSAADAAEEGADAFVPHFAILLSFLFTIACIGAFIFYLHHIPRTIAVANVIREVGEALHQKVQRLYPAKIGQDPGGAARSSDARDFASASIGAVPQTAARAPYSGYVQAIDPDGALAYARRFNAVISFAVRPGQFVAAGDPLLHFAGAAQALSDEQRTAAAHDGRDLFAIGTERTPTQDALFLADELIEIMARALSPGVNDPFTAVNCLDWLGVTLAELARRTRPSIYRYDEAGTLRVIAPSPTTDEDIQQICDRIRPYAATDPIAGAHYLRVLERTRGAAQDSALRERLLAEAEALLAGARAAGWDPSSLDTLAQTVAAVSRATIASRRADANVDSAKMPSSGPPAGAGAQRVHS